MEYKTEAYEMFVELMANIKNEVLHNLFRSTSNLQAFENFLSTLPQFLLREHGPGSAPTATGPTPGPAMGRRRGREAMAAVTENGDGAEVDSRSRTSAARNAESRPERALSLRQREEVQELLRPDGVARSLAAGACASRAALDRGLNGSRSAAIVLLGGQLCDRTSSRRRCRRRCRRRRMSPAIQSPGNRERAFPDGAARSERKA